MSALAHALSLAALPLAAGAALRLSDRRADAREAARLRALQPARPEGFDPARLAALPGPVRRYFGAMIAAGTPLLPVVEIEMGGLFGLGDKARPGYRPMRARQVLAAPEGFVWALTSPGAMPVAGSDSGRWTRFFALGLLPVARRGGTPDHARSAFGRMVAEAAFWAPAALLPRDGVTWEAPADDRLRVTVRHGGLEQAVELALDGEGLPRTVSFQRWSDANPDRRFRLQPFGGRMEEFRRVGGYRLPFRVEAGNHWGTPDYFPFFRAEVARIGFPGHIPPTEGEAP